MDESQIFTEVDKSQILLNVADSRRFQSYGKGRGYNGKVCSYCGKIGHIVDTCYKKYGFPPGFRFKGNNQAPIGASNAVSTEDFATQSDEVMTSKASSGPNLTREEYKALKLLLKSTLIKQSDDIPESHVVNNAVSISRRDSSSSITTAGTCSGFCASLNKNKDMWIVDNGASNHICCSLIWYSSYRKIIPISIQMPNGSFAKSDIAGDVLLNDSLLLKDVLYLPIFAFNKISISKITKAMKYSFIFCNDTCSIQDTSKRMIGSAKLIDRWPFSHGSARNSTY